MRTVDGLQSTEDKKKKRTKRLESCTFEKRLKALGLFNLQKLKRSRVINNSA